MLEQQFIDIIASEAGCKPGQVGAAAGLLAEGATVPFVARYRKEATSGLTDDKLEIVAKRREYFLELMERRDAVLKSISEQGKLTPELETAVRSVLTKQQLEDLYLPFKPKRRTRAQAAREKGLEPLADLLTVNAGAAAAVPADMAATFVDAAKGVEDAAAALAGARDILAERFAEDAAVRARLRETVASTANLGVKVVPGKEQEGAVFRDYFEHAEALKTIRSHRLLAVLRGEREGILTLDVAIDDAAQCAALSAAMNIPLESPCGREVAAAFEDGYSRLLRPSITHEVLGEHRHAAETEAVAVFRANLESLLMQSPLGHYSVMGIDPGQRTGCKVAVVEATGRLIETTIIHPFASDARVEQDRAVVLALAQKHAVHAIAIGNGTASRETESFVRRALAETGVTTIIVAIVPETGASVYSASALAREELPKLDVSLRGAVSIARRLQDPLAEMVKIEPRSLGVGQYQHDVNQKMLSRELETAVESVVNRVGVELNTASPALLRRVSGLTEKTARAIVAHRDERGPFLNRLDLREINGFGPKTFELAAGFLRVRDGANPLDNTAVHPERYAVVEAMARDMNVPLADLVGNPALVGQLDFARFADEKAGLGSYTLADIRAELERPGRDPRPEFKTPEWRDDVLSLDDLKPGMQLEGRVSNVTNFGAFVDIGIKRDGLVHLSELSHQWIEDPRQAVQVGQIVKVQVLEIDNERGRVSLSIKVLTPAPARAPKAVPKSSQTPAPKAAPKPSQTPAPKSPPADKDKRKSARPAKIDASRPPERKPDKKSETPARQATIEDLVRKFNRRK